MSIRLDYTTKLPGATEAMRGLERVVEASTLEPHLLELVKVRGRADPAIVAINGWTRLAVGFRRPVGAYASHRHPESAAV
jgi:hypothetical protein